jgi:hypothetical protein
VNQNYRETHVEAIRGNANARMTGRLDCFSVIIDSDKVEGVLTTIDLFRALQDLQYIVETAQK